MQLKFNVDGTSRGNSGDSRIGGIISDNKGKALITFSKAMGHDLLIESDYYGC